MHDNTHTTPDQKYDADRVFARVAHSNNVFEDAKYSGHYASHLNICCSPQNPCSDVDMDEYVLAPSGEWIYHPVDGVCAHSVYVDTEGKVCSFEEADASSYVTTGGNFIVFAGRIVHDFPIDDGVFVIPTKQLGVFRTQAEALEFLNEVVRK